jgi:hypothetical protein
MNLVNGQCVKDTRGLANFWSFLISHVGSTLVHIGRSMGPQLSTPILGVSNRRIILNA